MKRILLISSSLIFLSVKAYCQFTITSSNLPSVASSYSVSYLDTTGANEGAAGASQSWDFSSYAVKSTTTVNYMDPSGKPGASNFPTATLVMQSGAAYVYYLANTSTNTTLGLYQAASGQVATQTYSDPEVNYAFPLNYNTTQNDKCEGITSTNISGTIFTTYRTGNDTATADGYGTVKGPNGVTYSVVRVKTVQNFLDSTDFGGGDYTLQASRFETYNYYQQNASYPIISLSYIDVIYTDIFGDETETISKTLAFYSNGVTGINSNSISNRTYIYPNPVRDILSIELPDNKLYGLTLNDITGKAVLSSDNGTISIVGNNATADVASLSKGIYILQISSDTEKGVKKILVE